MLKWRGRRWSSASCWAAWSSATCFISIERYNFEWLYRPVVLITLLFTVYAS